MRRITWLPSTGFPEFLLPEICLQQDKAYQRCRKALQIAPLQIIYSYLNASIGLRFEAL